MWYSNDLLPLTFGGLSKKNGIFCNAVGKADYIAIRREQCRWQWHRFLSSLPQYFLPSDVLFSRFLPFSLLPPFSVSMKWFCSFHFLFHHLGFLLCSSCVCVCVWFFCKMPYECSYFVFLSLFFLSLFLCLLLAIQVALRVLCSKTHSKHETLFLCSTFCPLPLLYSRIIHSIEDRNCIRTKRRRKRKRKKKITWKRSVEEVEKVHKSLYFSL